MQIISKHWTDENLKSAAKSVNAPMINKYTGLKGYKAKAEQIEKVMEYVTKDNYSFMRKCVMNLDLDDSISGSSNFCKLINYFESKDASWIERINKVLEE